MFNFYFRYVDGNHVSLERITTAYVCGNMKDEVVQGDQMLTHNFSISAALYLRSENGNYTISMDGLRAIEVTKAG